MRDARALARAGNKATWRDVPICRAAFGALENLLCGPLYSAMEKPSDIAEPAPHSRARRWMREIIIAVLLTVAAIGFITAALLRGNGAPGAAPPFETARKPATQ
jgi:hypothetical protein